MHALFFPFTHIEAQALSAVAALLGAGPVIYRPSRWRIPAALSAWQAAGRLELRVPLSGDEEALRALWQDWQDWAARLSHAERSAAELRPPGVPFCDPEGSDRIRSRLRAPDAAQQPTGGREGAAGRLRRARLFLHLAEDHDLQQQAVAHSLQHCRDGEKRLLAALHGCEAAALPPLPANDLAADPGAWATAERVAAWCRLLAADPRQADPDEASALLITTSAAVFSHLHRQREGSQTFEMRAGQGGLEMPAAAERARLLERIVRGRGDWPPPAEAAGAGAIGLRLLRIPGCEPTALAGPARREGTPPAPSEGGCAPLRHTLVGLVTFPAPTTG
jgi:hypothetical protein